MAKTVLLNKLLVISLTTYPAERKLGHVRSEAKFGRKMVNKIDGKEGKFFLFCFLWNDSEAENHLRNLSDTLLPYHPSPTHSLSLSTRTYLFLNFYSIFSRFLHLFGTIQLSPLQVMISWIAKPGCIFQTILLEQTPWNGIIWLKKVSKFLIYCQIGVQNSMHQFILQVFFFQQSSKILRRKTIFPCSLIILFSLITDWK